MALDPESQIKGQELTQKEKNDLQKWIFNPPSAHTDDVEVTEETGMY